MVRKAGKKKPQGAKRFESRALDEALVFDKVMGDNTYALKSLLLGVRSSLGQMVNKVPAARIVKVELPGLGVVQGQRQLEYTTDGDTWDKATLVGVALDGRVKLERGRASGRAHWVDLSEFRYRWVH